MEFQEGELGHGEQLRISSSNKETKFLSKFQDWVSGNSLNQVAPFNKIRHDDFPPEVPSDALTSNDIEAFDDWLKSTDNFFVKPRRQVSKAISKLLNLHQYINTHYNVNVVNKSMMQMQMVSTNNKSKEFLAEITGIKSYACYDVCNAKNGIFFSLSQIACKPSYSKKNRTENADPINYILVNRDGHTVLSTEGDLQKCGKVNLWINGINRGYIRQHKNGNYSLFNQSHQLLFLLCWNGHSNVIIMGDENENFKSLPIGEMCQSVTGVHRLTIGKNLPSALKAMILGAHIVVMHKNISTATQCPPLSLMVIVLVIFLLIVLAVTFYWRV